jgi:tRNA (guanine-N7-)-methyltransferase
MNERVTPARPHQRLTEDGRPLRAVLTYARRGNRFSRR